MDAGDSGAFGLCHRQRGVIRREQQCCSAASGTESARRLQQRQSATDSSPKSSTSCSLDANRPYRRYETSISYGLTAFPPPLTLSRD